MIFFGAVAKTFSGMLLCVNIRDFALPGRRLAVAPEYIWYFMQEGKLCRKIELKNGKISQPENNFTSFFVLLDNNFLPTVHSGHKMTVF